MPEKQNIEWKQSWRDEYMKWISGFANAEGGSVFIGKTDGGTVSGITDYKKLMDDLPNKVSSKLGVFCEVNLHEQNSLYYIEIITKPYSNAISYNGKYYLRVGSTNQELTGIKLTEFLLKKSGRTWDDVIEPNATFDDINLEMIDAFKVMVKSSGRLPALESETDTNIILENLRLVENGKLKRAGLLLFGKEPKRFYISAFVKIGRFGISDSDLISQELIEGNLFDLAFRTTDILNTKYFRKKISYIEGQRVETPEYPFDAVREALHNALVHRVYESTPIQISIYDDRIIFWNQGELPDALSEDDLKKKHVSFPRNPNVAEAFFHAGFIESWGRGTLKIIEECFDAGLPEPRIEETSGGVSVTLFKEIFPDSYLATLDINERQKIAIKSLRKSEYITNSEYRALFDITDRTALRDIEELIELSIFKKEGDGRGTRYVIDSNGYRP
ncbi:ATP-binding protein [uncultured Psychroserpens sp.]|uniref:ATP-binding protein n=1 Tax=uncultured Psychroserpens sp. TaxID=255436 RepID=UPI0026373B63|nr:ATP-binding protein [uncultured Psychroserpens sp.]